VAAKTGNIHVSATVIDDRNSNGKAGDFDQVELEESVPGDRDNDRQSEMRIHTFGASILPFWADSRCHNYYLATL